jgi:hypothetical protein
MMHMSDNLEEQLLYVRQVLPRLSEINRLKFIVFLYLLKIEELSKIRKESNHV